MRQIKITIVGNGDRANCYCKYALIHPEQLKVVAVVDPDKRKQQDAMDKYGVSAEFCFDSVGDFLKKDREQGRFCDCIVNATMDQLHYETTMPLLEAGFHVLLEKPIVNNMPQLLEIKEAADKNNCILMICHVLRYTPFYKRIKELIKEGEIGEIVHIETSENVGVAHSSNSYIRGKWNSEQKCGSSMLLAKCCHDLDLLCWLNNDAVPVRVASFGGRNFIVPEKAPQGSGTRCLVDCGHVDTCQYSAKAIYVDNDRFPEYSWDSIPKLYSQITLEDKIDSLKSYNPHGVCAYKTGSDLVDHQTLILRFSNGSTATHTMILGAIKPCRKIRVIGTKGEIEGEIEESRLYLRKFDRNTALYNETEIDVSKDIPAEDRHAGGDFGIISDFVKMVRGESPSISCTKIEDSIYGHLCVYMADQSMKEDREKEITLL